MKFYLAGQTNFGNRGCEALTRTVISTLSEEFENTSFLVPATDPEADAKQWPQMARYGATFVSANCVPPAIKWWNRAIRLAPWIKPFWEPSYALPSYAFRDMAECDAILMIGGDTISLDYGSGSLFMASGFMDAAARAGHATMLVAASISPLKDPVFERYMARHLKRYSVITVRETESLAYLKHVGLDNAVLVADPAFALEPEAVEWVHPLTQSRAVLGFNISPVIEESWRRAGNSGNLVEESVAFLRKVLAETDLRVALIPHVDPLDDSLYNSDTSILDRIQTSLGGPSARLVLVPRSFNAAQLKYLIGRCRYFMGGRTHATIAAWSQGVPTISFAYSTKAYGLNKDLFGTLDFVLQTPRISRDSLWKAFTELTESENFIRSLLAQRIPEWKRKASLSANVLAEHLKTRIY
ncbi:polysaccharide pyruvyl transferase family protein [Nitrosovibrio sp. Nv4]|uniref:polysaccharide pyruvyl transferase family protein n=1 Tax=Nitrosovibrio sp. Nv4 TaxID=1945880 RepID=UPI000BC4523C|nr:polysaccharide pyruvyl transferase family protein [Nitrosovibrio sp. Nv4]SOD40091.1 Polysaccharide pyruvyl transferase family protein WcaK [Nitrosovibrio sp. Nv4]